MSFSEHYADHSWIKVKRWVEPGPEADPSARYAALLSHHEKETAWLIAEVRRLAATADELAANRREEEEPQSPRALPRYAIENRYQDSGWEYMGHEHRYEDFSEAVKVASGMSHESIIYGMVRVVDSVTGQTLVAFGAGSNGVPL